MEKYIRKAITLATLGRVPVSPPSQQVETRIPQVAHFVFGLWSDGPLPPNYQITLDNWEKQGWTARLWGPKEVNELLARYPDAKRVYDQVPRNVQRADIARYVIILDQGGFYMDCDAGPKHFSLLNFLQKKKDASAVYFIEEVLVQKWIDFRSNHFMREQIPEKHQQKICNYLFGSEAGNSVTKAVLDEALRRCEMFAGKEIDDLGVLTTTGPEVTTDIIQSRRNDVIIRHSNYFCDHGRTGTWRDEE